MFEIVKIFNTIESMQSITIIFIELIVQLLVDMLIRLIEYFVLLGLDLLVD